MSRSIVRGDNLEPVAYLLEPIWSMKQKKWKLIDCKKKIYDTKEYMTYTLCGVGSWDTFADLTKYAELCGCILERDIAYRTQKVVAPIELCRKTSDECGRMI